jgi:hypothetical protein
VLLELCCCLCWNRVFVCRAVENCDCLLVIWVAFEKRAWDLLIDVADVAEICGAMLWGFSIFCI